MVTVEIDKKFRKGISPKTLKQLVEAVFAQLQLPAGGSLSVRVSDNPTLQQLNAEYLGIDAPTDVLSFPVDFDDPESGGHYYGDIIVSYEKAAVQAEAGGHSVIDEIKLLVVHGILHLLGYDHGSEEEKQTMWSIQNRLLNELGINASPTE